MIHYFPRSGQVMVRMLGAAETVKPDVAERKLEAETLTADGNETMRLERDRHLQAQRPVCTNTRQGNTNGHKLKTERSPLRALDLAEPLLVREGVFYP